MSVTIWEVFEARRLAQGLELKSEYNAQEFADQNLAMIGGCGGCAAMLSASHAYPDRGGYWACEGCLQEGYETTEAFWSEQDNRENDEDDDEPVWWCEACGGEVVSQGVLGRREHGCCRACGIAVSREGAE